MSRLKLFGVLLIVVGILLIATHPLAIAQERLVWASYVCIEAKMVDSNGRELWSLHVPFIPPKYKTAHDPVSGATYSVSWVEYETSVADPKVFCDLGIQVVVLTLSNLGAVGVKVSANVSLLRDEVTLHVRVIIALARAPLVFARTEARHILLNSSIEGEGLKVFTARLLSVQPDRGKPYLALDGEPVDGRSINTPLVIDASMTLPGGVTVDPSTQREIGVCGALTFEHIGRLEFRESGAQQDQEQSTPPQVRENPPSILNDVREELKDARGLISTCIGALLIVLGLALLLLARRWER